MLFEKKGKEYKESLSKAGKDSVIQAFLKLSGYKISSPNKRKKKKNLGLYFDANSFYVSLIYYIFIFF